MTIAGGGTEFVSSVAKNWVNGEPIDVAQAMFNGAVCSAISFVGGPAGQFSTRGQTKAIKTTLKNISQRDGSWKKGLTKIYSNKLGAISRKLISRSMSGFIDDFASDFFQAIFAS